MELDVQDLVRNVVTNAVQGGVRRPNSVHDRGGSNGGLSGMKGVAAGAGAAALAPIAVKGAARLARELAVGRLTDAVKSPTRALGGVTSSIGDHIGSSVTEQIKQKIEHAEGSGGILKDAAKSMLSFGGGSRSPSKGGMPGVGKGRRMPVQQSVDIGLPIETVYNQWTQFEEWPNFMHRVTRVTQEDDCTVSFATKIWGKTKEFTANIETQRPNERIKWRVSQGITHTGVVSFHELGPNLTRVLLGFDVAPGSLIEKAARGMRHVKRAARGDLHRYKAFIEMAERETGAWRGVIENGEVVQEHDPSYDKQREYADIGELTAEKGSDGERRGRDRRSGEVKSRSGARRASTRGGDGSSRHRSSGSAASRSRASRTSSKGTSGRTGRGRSQESKR
jgi:uncharacterized membrane protein